MAAAALFIGTGVLIGMLIRPAPPQPAQLQSPAAATVPSQAHPSPAQRLAASSAPIHRTQHTTAQAAEAKPSFDVVRVTPQGSAVLAGRAFPGSQVTVRDGTTEIGKTRADANGAWVMVPVSPLPAGSHRLTVAAVPAQGGKEIMGKGSVIVAVAAPHGEPQTAVALATGPGASRVLQEPGTTKPGQLGVEALDYDQRGRIRLSGAAPPGVRVRAYIGDHFLGEAIAGPDGNWTLEPRIALTPGQHTLRLDQIGSNGQASRRVEVTFKQEDFARRALPPGSLVVEPGETLWRIAQARYGEGVLYTLIFNANRAEISNPNLIYPGQVFHVPGSKMVESPGASRR